MKKSIKICLFVVILLIDLKNGTCQVFTVMENKLLDANGNEFIIRGINQPSIWYKEKAYNSLDRLKELNVNCVRLVWKTTGAASLLDSVLNRCMELKMIPMIELHDATGDTVVGNLMKLVDYYISDSIKVLINKYQKYLMVNIANEWGDYFITYEFWRDAYMKCITRMRDAGINTNIVIDAPKWGQDIDPILKYGKDLIKYDPNNNILFSVHMYGFWNDSALIVRKLEVAHDSKLPLIIGEFGYNYNDGGNNLGCKANHKTILKKCVELGYGYIAWSWSGNSNDNEWLDMSYDWNSLTWWGREIFESENGIIKTAKQASVFKKE